MQAFFNYIQELGIYNVEDKGTIYGKIQGVSQKAGYNVRLDRAHPLYFMTAGFATLDLKATSENGLFAFVGLQDGDYELIVEKDGEILDQRLVVVEQGKVSPILVDLATVSKHLEFFDPMQPTAKISSVELSFFDGVSSSRLDRDHRLKQTLRRGQDLSLMEYKGKVEVSRTLLSRHKGLQKIPLINDQKLLKLAEKHDLSMNTGLIIGFIKSPEAYRVFLAEERPRKVLYFNNKGQVLSRDNQETAHGFMIGGFREGLSSLVIESAKDGVILGTDLIYSNHESISMTHLDILPR
jgi:hypothetical protein